MNCSRRQFAFTKKRRLLNPAQYQRVFDNVDCRQGGKYCTLLSASSSLDESRLGLIVAKKNLKLAVQRNRVKRLLRESFRSAYPQLLTLEHCCDVIALAKASAANASNEEIRNELQKQWLKLITRRREIL